MSWYWLLSVFIGIVMQGVNASCCAGLAVSLPGSLHAQLLGTAAHAGLSAGWPCSHVDDLEEAPGF